MSGQPAARIGDKLSCLTPQATPAAAPHAPAGMPLTATGAPTVQIGGKPAARMSDFSLCPTPVPVPNPIMRGAFPVPIMNMPAARMTDSGTAPHVGVILPPCCPTVLIGLSGTAGNVRVGTNMCQAAAQGRASNSTAQSTNNCGLESSRQVMNQSTGGNATEAQLFNQATTTASAARPGGNIATANGGTWPATQAELLTSSGVPAAAGQANATNVALAMSQGRGAIANVDAGALWPTTHGISPGTGSWHAVTVTGVEFDDNGRAVAYHINDTGPQAGPNCNVRVPAATFEGAMGAYHTPGQGLVTTSNAIW